MKRKFLSIIFAICLIVLSSVFFVACGEDPPPPEAPKYNITLNANGGTLPSDQSATITIEKDAKFAWPKLPTKSGHDFIGWTLDSAGNDYYKFDTTLASKDITLYAQYVAENTYTYELDEKTDTYIITGGDNTLTRIVTPFMHGGKAVSGIGYAAFVEFEEEPDEHGYPVAKNNETIREVIITPNIKTIDDGAFSVAKNLESVYFYDGCETLDMAAFDSCDKLASVRLPETLTTLGAMTFNDCDALTTIKIPNSITKLQARLFSYCENLTSVEFGNITYIGDYCFEDTKISSFNFPSSLTNIRTGAFWGTKFTSVTIPATVTYLGRSAFACCPELETATIMGNVTQDNTTQDDYGVFAFCKKLKTVNLPDTLTEISRNMFYGCSALESFTLPRDCTSIKYRAFYHCTNLTDFTFNEKLEYIGEKAFVGAKISVHTLPDSVETICDYAFNHHTEGATCQIYINRLPSSLGTIYWHALYGLNGLYIDELPAGLTYIEGPSPFGINTSYAETLRIPEGTTGIVREAFYDEAVNKVVLPQGLERIGIESFRYSNLTEINIPASVTRIGEYAFANCEYLTKITFEGTNIDIDPTAFYGTTGVGILTIGENVTEIAAGQYSGTEYTVVIIPGNVERIGARAFENCTNLQQVIFKEGLQIIDEDAFKGCTSITSLRLPDSVVSVGEGAFYGMDNLEFLELGEGFDYDDCTFDEIFSLDKALMEINNRSSKDLSDYIGGDSSVLNIYDGDTESSARVTEAEYEWFITDNDVILLKCLTDIFIDGKENLVLPLKKNGKDYRIGDYAFADKEGLISVTLPSGLKGIGKGAFENCRNLMSINIPSGVTRIEDETFSLCSSLSNIALHNNVTHIGKDAFTGCHNLTDFNFPTALEYVGHGAFNGAMTATTYNDIDYVGTSSNPYLIAIGVNYNSSVTNISFHDDCKFVAMDATNWQESAREIFIHAGIEVVDMHIVYSYNYMCTVYVERTALLDGWTFNQYSDETFDDGVEIVCNVKEAKSNETFKYIITLDNEVIILGMAQAESGYYSLVIPDEIDGLPVTTIRAHAFDNYNKYNGSFYLDSLILGSNITHIGEYAFTSTKLPNVIIPDGVEYIGEYAFSDTSILGTGHKRLYLPSSLTYVGSHAFTTDWDNVQVPIYLKHNSVPNTWANDWVVATGGIEYTNIVTGIKYYGDNGAGFYYAVFSDNTVGITDYDDINFTANAITIPADTEYQGSSAMSGEIISVLNITKICDYAFYNVGCITSVQFGSNILSIGKYAFSQTSIYGDLVLPQSLDSIDDYAFYDINAVNVTLNSGLQTIGDYAFAGIYNATLNGTIPSSLHTIGDLGIYSLKPVDGFVIPESITYLGEEAIQNANSVSAYFAEPLSKPSGWHSFWDETYVVWGYLGEYSTDEYHFGLKKDGKAVLFGTVTTIYSEEDAEQNKLPIRLPDSVTVEQKTYTVIGLGGKDLSFWDADLIIPYTYERILDNAFANTYNWQDAYGVYSVTIEDTAANPSRLKYIGKNAFYSNKELVSINIPASVTHIGDYAFYSCSILETVEMNAELEVYNKYIFASCSKLTGINLGTKVKEIGEYAFLFTESMESISLPNTLKVIGEGAFEGGGLTSITLPTGLEKIGEDAFFDCNNLTSINIPSTVTEIGDSAFDDTGITTIVVPGSVGSIVNISSNISLYVLGEGVNRFEVYNSVEGNKISIVIPTSLNSFGYATTEYIGAIYYMGTYSQAEELLYYDSEMLSMVYIYSATEPTDSTYNYWHFDTDGVTPVYW